MIVSDSSPLIYLAKIGRLTLLKDLYKEVIVSDGVIGEVLIKGKPGTTEIEKALDEGWSRRVKAKIDFDPESDGISKVDAELICLARDKGLQLLTNDRALFYCAKSHGVKSEWFTLMIIKATKSDLLSPDDAEELLTELVHSGLRIRSEVLAELVRQIRDLKD
ncbi:hypothetical protein AKJ48_00240 [candidate division MSBL1 archaeon SCGC-AAA261O19]|uniref:PIN domain-containing protein n=1 Tax=candidate division MSBL1 archaeon SCGC-AAA261O19 TaxID=1698277 RepID=A0A133VFA3_9EURY|nr:hypothetical protein AKJ48_00240 [candidate division MSBL1 archaeon SCGC-AAA261O19]